MKTTNFILSLGLMLMSILLPSSLVAQNVIPQVGDKVETADGIYVVAGSNLIPNPSFDYGFADWLAGNNQELSEDNFEIIGEGGADGGAYLKAKGSAGSGSASSIKKGWPVEIGKTYLFSMWALRSASGMSSNTQYSRIYASDSETGTNAQIGSVNFKADTWTQTKIVFTAERPFLVVNLGWMNSSAVDAFYLGELEASGELATGNLEAAIADGKYQLENTVEGSERGQYTAEVRAALQAAIDAAEAVLASATTQDEINAAVTAMQAAISRYKLSANAPFTVGKKYNIVHSSGYYMTTTGGTVKIVTADVDDKGQVFQFVPVPEGAAAEGYNLQAEDGTFVFRSGSWDTKASADQDVTIANAIFQVIDQTTYIQLKNMGSGSVLGTDNNNDGSTVYSNKNGTDGKYRWTLKEFVPKDERDEQYNFEELLGKAQKMLADVSESSLGTGLFMNSREAYNTFAAAVAEAEAVTADWEAAMQRLQAAMDTYTATKQNKPDPTKLYIITQEAGGNRLAYNAEQELATVATPSADATQQFYFQQPKDSKYFSLKNAASGKFLGKSSSSAWNTNWVDEDTDALAQWGVAVLSDGVYTLQNASGKGYLGSDATEDGALLYCDKSNTAANSRWIIEEYSAAAALERAIADAKALAENTDVGTNYYEVPQSAMDALLAAIAAAENALPGITTFEGGAAEADKLQTAIATFNASFNPLGEFDEGQAYIVTHYGGNVLTATATGNATITALAEDGATEQQIVMLEKVEGMPMTYNFRSVGLGTYLARTGDYNTQWQDNADEQTAINVVQLDGRWLGLAFTATGMHAGTDGSGSGQMVYSDKSGRGNSLAYWTIEPYVTVVLDREAFNAALDQANELLSAMQPGYLAGQYFPEDINAFRQLIASTRSAANKAKDQATLDAITAQFLLDIEAARAKAHTQDYMNHSELAAAISAAEKSLETAVAGDLNGQYPAEAIEAYRTALAAAKEVNETPDDQLTQAVLDQAAQALKAAAQTFAQAIVKINYTLLNAQIADAQKAIRDNEAFKGDGPGKIPQSAFDALQAEIEKAQAIVKGNTQNQAGVDAETLALTDAVEAFKASRVENDYALLEQYVGEAEELLAAVDRGEIQCEQEDYDYLRASLDKNSPYLYSTDQDAIDRAAKLMRRDVLLFKSIITAISGVMADLPEGYAISIFTAEGRQVSAVRRGINILRISDGQNTIVRKVLIK